MFQQQESANMWIEAAKIKKYWDLSTDNSDLVRN
jgi:hypothetical protein